MPTGSPHAPRARHRVRPVGRTDTDTPTAGGGGSVKTQETGSRRFWSDGARPSADRRRRASSPQRAVRRRTEARRMPAVAGAACEPATDAFTQKRRSSSAAPPAMGSLRQRGVPSVDGVGSSPSGEESHAGGANGNTAPRRSLEGRWDGDGERPTGCPARPALAAQPPRTSPGQQLSRPAVCPILRATDCQRQCSRVPLVSNRARLRRARGLSVDRRRSAPASSRS